MSPTLIPTVALRRALALRDLTDPADGPHAMQLVIDALTTALTAHPPCALRVVRASPIVSVADNYDRLHYPPGAAARDARYSRYVCEGALLRTQTSALIPPALRALAAAPPAEVLCACPGLVYRRDAIDRHHVGEPHQLDLWRIRAHGPALDEHALEEMIALVVATAVPGCAHRTTPASHPYTLAGRQIDVRDGARWVEIGECGLALPALLEEAGLAGASGLAMGLGLDRIVMLQKGVGDIRLLRSPDPRIAAQMLDLAPYRPVSSMPAVRRDLSLAVAADVDVEALGDAVRDALGARAEWVESVALLGETPCEALPAAAVARLGMRPGQKNVLVRLTLRALDRTLAAETCNELRDVVYAALHAGSAWHWAGSARAALAPNADRGARGGGA